MKIKLLILNLWLLSLNVFSQNAGKGIIFTEKNYIFPYQLTKPDDIQKLPSKLIEISGLAFINENHLAGVQDEKGNIYVVNYSTTEIEYKVNFADDGDFEGVTLVDNTAWILKSSGDLYRVKNFMKGEEVRRSKKFETLLSKKNDAEGLAYDSRGNRLLIACKGHPYIKDKKGKHKKAIYAFDLEKEELIPEPVFVIDLVRIKNFREYNSMTQWGIDLLSSFDENKGDVSFQPSGIAIHPQTGNIYVLGAVGDLLLVLNREGELIAMIDLDDHLFRQPEGICFDDKGNLYISNEGGDGKATLLKFYVH